LERLTLISLGVLVHHQQPDGSGELELQRLLGQGRGEGERLPFRVEAAHHRAARWRGLELHLVPKAIGEELDQLVRGDLPVEGEVPSQRLGVLLELGEPVALGLQEVGHLVER